MTDTKRRVFTEEEQAEFVSYLKPARERHITDVPSIAPGFSAKVIDTEVYLPTWDKTVPVGTVFTPLPDKPLKVGDVMPPSLDYVFVPVLYLKSTEADEAGELRFSLRRFDLEKGRPLQFFELVAWIAINDAEKEGDREKAHRIFDLAYGKAAKKKHARKTTYERKDGGNLKSTTVTTLSGPLTNALMGRNKGTIEAASYFDSESCEVTTGAGGHVLLDVRAAEGTEIDAPYREYRLNDRDRFWLDPLYTLAINEGRHTIEGSEILKLRGYSNPFATSSAATMADALKSISKAVSTTIAIDVTHEKRNKRKNNARLVQSTRLQPVVNAVIDLDRYEGESGEVKDFTVILQTPDPVDSLPLARYELDRHMLTTVSTGDFDFKGIKLTADDRQMWAYVLRIVNSNKLSDTILFETMWRNLEIEEPEVSPYAYVDRKGNPLDGPLNPKKEGEEAGKPVDPKDAPRATEEQRKERLSRSIKKQRRRMLKKLERMLDAKKGELFKGWSYHKDNAGRIDGVKVSRKKN